MKTSYLKAMLFLLPLLLYSSLLPGCANLNPKEYQFEKSRVVNLSTATVLTRIKLWCVDNDFVVESATSDMLYASSDLRKVQGVTQTFEKGLRAQIQCADCGGNVAGSFVASSGKINVFVEKVTDTETKVTISFTAKPQEGTLVTRCTSTGKLEAMIFDTLK